jgi:membrane protease YdiL (CAAX protease family)
MRYTIFVVLTLALTIMVGYGTYRTAQLLRTWRPERNILLLPGENLARLALLGFCVLLGLLSGLPPAQLGWTLEPLLPQIGWGLLIGVSLAFLLAAATRLLVVRTGRRFYSTTVLEIIVPRTGRELVGVLVMMVPVVLLEELLFRSLLLGGLQPIAPVALLLAATGIVFGLMHSPQGVWGMAGAGLAGVGLGMLFLWAGSLVLPVVAHYAANVVQIGIAMRTGLSPGLDAEEPTAGVPN